MDKPIAKTTREHYKSKLFIQTFVFFVFILTLSLKVLKNLPEIFPNHDHTLIKVFIYLAPTLPILYIFIKYIYAKFNTIIFFETYFNYYFTKKSAPTTVHYNHIEKIKIKDKTKDYSSMLFKLNTGEELTFHLIDNPTQVKRFIETISKGEDIKDLLDYSKR